MLRTVSVGSGSRSLRKRAGRPCGECSGKQTGCLGAHIPAILLELSQHPGDGSSRTLSSQTTKPGVWGDTWVSDVLAAQTWGPEFRL